jgi:hypothetical protein
MRHSFASYHYAMHEDAGKTTRSDGSYEFQAHFQALPQEGDKG